MKKTWKKSLSIFLTLSMVTALAPATAWADNDLEGDPTQIETEQEKKDTEGTTVENDGAGNGTGANTIVTTSAATTKETITETNTENTIEEDEPEALADVEYAAMIGEQGYETLDAAITEAEKATEAVEIVLLKDATVNNLGTTHVADQKINKLTNDNLTFDLNGCTLTYTGPSVNPQDKQTLKFIDTSNQKGELVLNNTNFQLTTNAYFNPQKGGAVIAKGITVDCAHSAFFPSGDAALVEITDCDVTAACYCVGTNAATTDNYNVQINLKNSTFTSKSNDGDNTAVLINVEGELDIDNCDITGDRQGVVVRAGKATIKDSRITVTGSYADAASKYHSGAWKGGNEVPAAALTVGNYDDKEATNYLADAVVTLTDTKVTSDNKDVPAVYVDANHSKKGEVEISGDKTEVKGAIMGGQNESADKNNMNTTIVVSGGEFSQSVEAKYLDKGLMYEAENEGVFTYHKTLSDAQAAGSTVTQVKTEDGTEVEADAEKVSVTINPNNGKGETTLTVLKDTKITAEMLGTPVKSRYKFRGWLANGTAIGADGVTAEEGMTITASWKKKSSSSSSSSSSDEKTYTVSKADVENGKVKVDPAKAEKGDKVTITVTPDKGYEINKVRVTDADGNKIDLKDKGNGEYTFTMPASKVEVKATFTKAEEKPVEPEDKTIVLTINQLAVSIFGDTKINDVAPIIRNDRTMLPIRVVAEALGATVTWNDSLKQVTITKDDLTIEIFIGSPFAKVNGTPVQLDSPAFIENSRTYLPIRFVAENLGADVAWDQATQQVTITPGK